MALIASEQLFIGFHLVCWDLYMWVFPLCSLWKNVGKYGKIGSFSGRLRKLEKEFISIMSRISLSH